MGGGSRRGYNTFLVLQICLQCVGQFRSYPERRLYYSILCLLSVIRVLILYRRLNAVRHIYKKRDSRLTLEGRDSTPTVHNE